MGISHSLKAITEEMEEAQQNGAITFNVGGKHYKVTKSLFNRFNNTMLARVSSSIWNVNPKAGPGDHITTPIFIESDGERFRYILDYMRHGRVDLPLTESRQSLIRDRAFFGFEGVTLDAIDEGTAHFEAVSHTIKVALERP